MYSVCHCCGEFLVDREDVCKYCATHGGSPTLPCNRYPHLRREERNLEGARMKPKEGEDFEWEHEYSLEIVGTTTIDVCGTEDDSESDLLHRADTWGIDFDNLEIVDKSLSRKNVRRVAMNSGKEFTVEEWEREHGLDEWSEPWEKERTEPKKITEF